jgi:hypothetical protein
MAQSLSKQIWVPFVFILLAELASAQVQAGEASRNADYKDPVQHEKFYKRRNAVSAWQINQLKNGALVVRLKTNKLAIDELNKAGKTDLARQKELESFAINKITMIAFRDYFNFCKVYFLSSNFSDSLLNGARSGIFLDTNMNVDPTLKMTENFYLLAERDYSYNSSIGFVPEDSARGVQEKGNAVKQMAFVIKNKYGHQLKNPFPYSVGEKTFMNATYDFPITFNTTQNGRNSISFYVDKTYLKDLENEKERKNKMHKKAGNASVSINKQYTYEELSQAVQQLNNGLHEFYRSSPSGGEGTKSPDDVKPFLY